MNVNKELDALMNDPLLQVSDKEKELFSFPEDMKKAMEGKKSADYVAQYNPCIEFELYKPLFKKVHLELKTGLRSVYKVSKTASLNAGRFYFVDGVMLFLESVGELVKEEDTGYLNGRTRCILENGTETDIFLQTLRKNVVSNGYGITDVQSDTENAFMQPSDVNDEDVETGYIYVLSSLSKVQAISELQNFYKIGFTTSTVENRIKNAENEPPYLMAPVRIEASYRMMNLNSHIFETIIHRILDVAQVQLVVKDNKGEEHHPKEWFQVPLPVINTIIEKISNGSITEYTYNPDIQCLERTIIKKVSTLNLKGIKVLNLNIKKNHFDAIISGEETIESRTIKQSTLKKFTYVDKEDGKRYLKKYDVLHLFVGYHKNEESAIVEVLDTTNKDNTIYFHLGKVIEYVNPKENAQ